jgi:uncharacterized repeat protein (TIGR01451 family)
MMGDGSGLDGPQSRGRPDRERGLLRRLPVVLAIGMLAAIGLAPTTAAASPVELSTPYPAVAVAPGSKVSFDLTVKTTSSARVGLAVDTLPQGWTAVLHGGSFVIDGVQTTAGVASPVRLDVSVPTTATGTQQIVVRATGLGVTVPLALDLRVEASAAGDVKLTTDFPTLKGAAGTTFTFNLTLTNDTAEDLTFNVTATGPTGWDVQAKLSGQSQAASAIVKAGSTTSVTITATPPDGVAAASYPIAVEAAAGARKISGKLAVEIIGSYKLMLTTPDSRLSTHGTAGTAIRQTLVVKNDGTAPLDNVKFTSSPPTGWKVTFEPADTLATVAPQSTGQVTAVMTPSGDAIAGDYVVSFTARNDQANASQDIRVTVETSLLWGLVGVALIVAVLGGLYWVFRTYGRR